MKLRNGFVSNSSSSSFICIAKLNTIENLINEEKDKITKKIVSRYLNSTNCQRFILDNNRYEIWNLIISSEDLGLDCSLTDKQLEVAYNKWIDFTDKLKHIPNVFISERGY